MSEFINQAKSIRRRLKIKLKAIKLNKPLLATIIIGLSIPLTVLMAMQKTNIKQQAASGNVGAVGSVVSPDYVKKYPLNINVSIVNLQVDGNAVLFSGKAYVRVVLVDKNKNEYLVYENYPLISQKFQENVVGVCEETCVLPSVVPDYLRIEGNSSDFIVSKVTNKDSYNGRGLTAMRAVDRNSLSDNVRKTKDLEKFEKIKKGIVKNHISWKAGETSFSKLTYAQKRKLLNLKKTDHLPNLQGLEYYKGGIFKPGVSSSNFVSGGGNTPTPIPTVIIPSPAISNLPKSWDYRNYQGENWNTTIKNQGGCGSCWDFAAAATIEGETNLYYNQHLNLDLSEQDILSCSNAGNCTYGGYPTFALDYARTTGVSDEACFSYQASDLSCSNKCSDYQSRVTKIYDNKNYSASIYDQPDKNFDVIIKNKLITDGVVSAIVPQMNHAMSLVGWQDDPSDSSTVWIFKNSWGSDWGENGYGRLSENSAWISYIDTIIPPIAVPNNPNLQISCVDKDNDNYCNWGISSTKPLSCPAACKSEKDCNDNDPNALGFNADYGCNYVVKPPQDTTPPTAPIATYVNNYIISATSTNPQTRWAELYWSSSTDNVEVFGYEVYLNGVKIGNSSSGYFYYRNDNWQSGETLSFYVRAYDAAGNFSPNSNTLQTMVLPAPSPYPTPIVSKDFSWKTNYVSVNATDAHMIINNSYYYFPISNYDLNSSPTYLSSDGYYYTTLEASWMDNNIPMKMNWYFKYKPGEDWQVYDLRTYDGTSNGSWINYNPYDQNWQAIHAPIGQSYKNTGLIISRIQSVGGGGTTQIYFGQIDLQPFLDLLTPTITPTLIPTFTPTPKPTVTLTPTPTLAPPSTPTGLSALAFCQGTIGTNQASGLTFNWGAASNATYYLQSYSGKTDVNMGTAVARRIPVAASCIAGPGGCSFLYGEMVSWQVKACNSSGCSVPAKATVATKYCAASFTDTCARCAVKQSNGNYLIGGMCGADGKTLCQCSGTGKIKSKSTCSTSCQVNSGVSDTCSVKINLCSRCAIKQSGNKYLIGGVCSFDGKTLCQCSGAGTIKSSSTCNLSCQSIPGVSDACFK